MAEHSGGHVADYDLIDFSPSLKESSILEGVGSRISHDVRQIVLGRVAKPRMPDPDNAYRDSHVLSLEAGNLDILARHDEFVGRFEVLFRNRTRASAFDISHCVPEFPREYKCG